MDIGKGKESEKGKFFPKKKVKTFSSEANEHDEANEAQKLLLQLEKMASFRSQLLISRLVADAYRTSTTLLGIWRKPLRNL